MFYHVSLCRDWAAETPDATQLAHALMPDSEHVIAYHLIARGDSWAATDGLPPVRLQQGDIVMFPRGDRHVLSSAPGLRATPDDSDWQYVTRHHPRPITLAWHRGVLRPGTLAPGEEASTIVICGFIGCDLRPFNPLIAALPRLLHVPARDVAQWIGPILEQAVQESRQHLPGSDAVLDRVSEMVFVDAVRRHLASLPGENAARTDSGWLAALRDPQIGRAVSLLHAAPEKNWTVEELGRQIGMSRSALHERFVGLLGQAPMHYLTQWRLQCGARLLRESTLTVAHIAQEVGYESEAAFSRAFKRALGHPPASWRRQQADSSDAAKTRANVLEKNPPLTPPECNASAASDSL